MEEQKSWEIVDSLQSDLPLLPGVPSVIRELKINKFIKIIKRNINKEHMAVISLPLPPIGSSGSRNGPAWNI